MRHYLIKTSFFKKNFYFFLPVVTAVLSAGMRLAGGPYWLGINMDPAYLYLINSLYYFRGIASHFTDHPGTTLHMLFVTLIWGLHPGQNSGQIIDDVLRHPEFYLNAMSIVLIFLFVATLAILGWYAYRVTGSKTFALLLQCPTFLYLTLKAHNTGFVFPILANVNAEPLMITVINVLFIFILKLYKQERKTSTSDTIMLAMICAAGLATKFTFAPLIFLPLLLIKGWRPKIIFCVALVIFFFIFLLPIWGRYEQMAAWLAGVFSPLTNAMTTGEGTKSWAFYTYGWEWILLEERALIIMITGLLLIFVFLQQKRMRFAGQKFIFGGLGAIVITLLVVADHPGPQYLIAADGAAGITAAFLYLKFRKLAPKRANKIGSIILIFLLCWGSTTSIVYSAKLAERTKERMDFYQHVRTKYAGCKIVGYYRSSGPEYALYFGDGTKDVHIFGKKLNDLYPGWYFFHIFEYKVSNWAEDVLLSDAQDQNQCIVFQGTCGYSFDQGPYQTELVERGPDECVDRLVKSTENQAINASLMSIIALKKGDYQKSYLAVQRAREWHFPLEKLEPQLKQICPHRTWPDVYHLCGQN